LALASGQNQVNASVSSFLPGEGKRFNCWNMFCLEKPMMDKVLKSSNRKILWSFNDAVSTADIYSFPALHVTEDDVQCHLP
jgi:hypothetical protein